MMDRFLGRYTPYIFAILRIVSGLMFAMHGSQKLLNMPAAKDMPVPIASIFGVGGIIELVGGLMIALGLFGSFAAFIASGEMAFAYFMFHVPTAILPVQNVGDAPVLYCFLFLYIAAHGSGIWSIDSLMGRKTVTATS